jgi:hypothetical protein
MLKTLYALAIALLVVAFVGFGISAFYPEPEPPDYPPGYPQGPESVGSEPTKEEKLLMAGQREEEEAFRERLSDYNRVVASVSIGLAVVLLVGSLLWISGVPIIGDGVTLGAVFTLFYGLVRALMTEEELFRFVAVAAGLVVVLAFVYWRFIRSGEGSPT